MREIQVLFAKLMAMGFEDKAIADILAIPQAEIRAYHKQVHAAFGVRYRSRLTKRFPQIATDYPLTPLQIEVLSNLSIEMQEILNASMTGLGYDQLGEYLNTSASGIRKRVERIRVQLNLSNRQALLWLFHVYQMRYGSEIVVIPPTRNLTEETQPWHIPAQ